jgi:hypothetical protein
MKALRYIRQALLLLLVFVFVENAWATDGDASTPKNHRARTVTVNGKQYRVFYHWTNAKFGDELISYGGYGKKLHQSTLNYAANVVGGTSSFNDPGLNVSSNMQDADFLPAGTERSGLLRMESSLKSSYPSKSWPR